MGRGGPAEPELLSGGERLGQGDLLAASRAGRHAASDHYEDAVLAGVTTVGCRRCGGGMAGSPFDSNVAEGVTLARVCRRRWWCSRAAERCCRPWPPRGWSASVAQGNRQTTSSAIWVRTGYSSPTLSSSRCARSPSPARPASRRCRGDRGREAGAQGRPHGVPPAPPRAGRGGARGVLHDGVGRGAAAGLRAHLEAEHGAEVVLVCSDLADRPALTEAVTKAARDADVFVTEIKAAAIDVVAEARRGGRQAPRVLRQRAAGGRPATSAPTEAVEALAAALAALRGGG